MDSGAVQSTPPGSLISIFLLPLGVGLKKSEKAGNQSKQIYV